LRRDHRLVNIEQAYSQPRGRKFDHDPICRRLSQISGRRPAPAQRGERHPGVTLIIWGSHGNTFNSFYGIAWAHIDETSCLFLASQATQKRFLHLSLL
jgi:hypothetical protein